MKVEEAKKYLNDCGFILEDTETLDDEFEDLHNEIRKEIINNPDKISLSNKLSKKHSELMDKVRDKSVEKKVNDAVNFNMRNFFDKLEEKFDIYDFSYSTDDYDTVKKYQSREYFFEHDADPDDRTALSYNVELKVDYYDEKGIIKLWLIEWKKKKRKHTVIEVTRIDDAVEEVFDWFKANTKGYKFYMD